MISSLSGKLGKQISFNIVGNELTYNRDILYSIDEALLHLLRNAIDHGIENQEERVNIGKEASGNIILKFEKDIEGKLLVEINDDGKGINIEEIKTKIIEKEFSSAEEIKEMSEQEILSFILKPDFSTKEQVTDVSGRGVGMDVVNSNIAKLGGKLIINSELGKGTNFTIEL